MLFKRSPKSYPRDAQIRRITLSKSISQLKHQRSAETIEIDGCVDYNARNRRIEDLYRKSLFAITPKRIQTLNPESLEFSKHSRAKIKQGNKFVKYRTFHTSIDLNKNNSQSKSNCFLDQMNPSFNSSKNIKDGLDYLEHICSIKHILSDLRPRKRTTLFNACR